MRNGGMNEAGVRPVARPERFDAYVKRALGMRAVGARVIPAESVVTGQWVLEKCRFGCSVYGRRLTCPPHSPTPEETRDVLSAYRHALLIHGGEGTPLNDIVVTLEREMFLDGFERAFAMGAGPCFLCDECSPPCKYPGEARPSMEACGIDVYSTVKAHGFPIEVLKDENCKPNYYGLVLIE
jgi:predicted metal-binding protein